MRKSMEEQFPVRQILSPEGKLIESVDGWIDDELALDMYEKMVINRTFDRKSVTMQRQGRIGTYAPFEGQEATQVGSAMALDDQDWLFPTYRDHAAMMTFGQSILRVLLYWKGRIEGCVPPEGKHILPPYVPIATQIPHAAGVAWSSKMKGEAVASIVYFGDGATSEGDFHEGLNFASVYNAPVVFFCQNNGYAISVPMSRQMKTKTIAQKALAYDIEGIRIDGNDIFAVYLHTRQAVEKAKRGEGPTLIEAVTYRYGAHTTADDPRKYREQEKEEKIRREKYDPVDRLRRYLESKGLWDDEKEQALVQKAETIINQAVKEMESYPAPQPEDMFEHIFAEKTWNIKEQQQQVAEESDRQRKSVQKELA